MLQEIISQLDAELEHLRALRRIVADLAQVPAAVRNLTPKIDVLLKAAPIVEVERGVKGTKRPGRPRKQDSVPSVPRKPAAQEPAVFSRPVHQGPVVMSPAQLEGERAGRTAAAQANLPQPQMAAEVSNLDLDSMSRNLTARWLTSSVQ